MASPSRPRFDQGVPLREFADGQMLAGTVGEEEVLLIRRGAQYFAIGAACTHYHGALADGLLVGDSVRCPLHHACFDVRTGRALHAPALDPVSCWRVEREGERLYVRSKLEPPATVPAARGAGPTPKSVLIVGGGAAGTAAAVMLREEGYAGALTLVSADDSPPCDRPNLSKDYLAGTAPEEWMALRPPEFYTQRHVELLLNARVATLDPQQRVLRLQDGRELRYDALLLATGAEPVRLNIAGADAEQLLYLRSFADGRALVARASAARRVAVIGASFIGLEVAASLRARGVEVHVIAPEPIPMQRVLGPQAGRFIQGLHEQHGVTFHLGSTVTGMSAGKLNLSDGAQLPVDFVVAGVGVKPAIGLAEAAGLRIDRGVLVDAYLQTSAEAVFAAGDIARWPDPFSGERIRVEHWVVAERQGQVAARNMLGRRERFEAVPFFWSQHYDVTFDYVGHAESWDAIDVEGTLESRQCVLRYRRAGRTLAVVTLGRERDSLQAELAMESDRPPAPAGASPA